jgi:hypothetical protein
MILVSDLRLALSILYSLPPPPSRQQQLHDRQRPTPAQAHEYLLQFQSRNPRRKIKSQSKPQQQNQQQQQQQQQDSADIGSTWLACLGVISSLLRIGHDDPNRACYTEALFAAQTIVHRLRRVKLSEAIDVEFETSERILTIPLPEQILALYRTWVIQTYEETKTTSSASYSSPAFLCLPHLIRKYHPLVDPQQSSIELEDRIKGEISMMVLAAILDALTKTYQQQHTDDVVFTQIRPLLVTLASAMATIAARMRYVPHHLPSAAPHTQPVVNTILGSLSMVQSQQDNEHQQQEVLHRIHFICLAAIPDAILQQGGGGGAYGWFSLEGRCYTAVTSELKTESLHHVWESLKDLIVVPGASSILILQMLEAWAKHVPLPNDFLSHSTDMVLNAWQKLRSSPSTASSVEAKAAMGFWISIMDGGSLTVDQILSASLIQSKEASQQPNKKKQSSRSKKREKQVLEERTTDNLLAAAENEVKRRGEIACTMAYSTWTVFEELLHHELNMIAAADSEQDEVEGGGPIGAIASCASACLPYMVREVFEREDNAINIELFVSISRGIQQVCSSPSQLVRGFAAESLFNLHEVLMTTLAHNPSPSSLSSEGTRGLLEIIIDHFYICSMSLASQCGYPPSYFDDLSSSNDDDLENERNDVRDILRTVSGLPSIKVDTGSCFSLVGIVVSSNILLRLIEACRKPIEDAAASNVLFPETALHAFSALAKPINAVAMLYASTIGQPEGNEDLQSILKICFHVSSLSGRCIIQSFAQNVPEKDILPLSRLYDLALASLSPTLATLVNLPSEEPQVLSLMNIAIEAAALSLLRLPELTAPSSLRGSRFDIKGAMRSPGGMFIIQLFISLSERDISYF